MHNELEAPCQLLSLKSPSFDRKKCDQEKRKKLLGELQQLLRGKIKSVRVRTKTIIQKLLKDLYFFFVNGTTGKANVYTI